MLTIICFCLLCPVALVQLPTLGIPHVGVWEHDWVHPLHAGPCSASQVFQYRSKWPLVRNVEEVGVRVWKRAGLVCTPCGNLSSFMLLYGL